MASVVPYLVWEIRRGKARGRRWFKERGHSEIGPDPGGSRITQAGY
jgi:hypothetical protein